MAIPVPKPVNLELLAGVTIVCPDCKAEIAVLQHTIRMGALLNAEDFVFKQDGHDPGSPMECRVCHAAFCSPETGALHTTEGWQPPLPVVAFRG